jgi:hypothetical protein
MVERVSKEYALDLLCYWESYMQVPKTEALTTHRRDVLTAQAKHHSRSQP